MKRVPVIVLVGWMILSFAAAPVLADAPLPELPADQPLEGGGIGADDYIPEGDIGVDFEFKPLSPTGVSIFSKTPKYYFTRYTGVTEYKLEVRNHFSNAIIFTFPFTVSSGATCGTAYCWVKPPNQLSTYKYNSEAGGWYYWRIAAKVGTAWVWSPDGNFYVISKGFTSTFDIDTKNWKVLNGTWTRVDPGYYKTTGIPGTSVYALNKLYILNNAVYEIRMKRKGEAGLLNRIYIMGIPGDLTNGHWALGYMLQYWNTYSWNLYYLNFYAPQSIASGTSPYLEPGDWNTFTFWRSYPYIYLWFNGVFIGEFKDENRDGGLVGIGMEVSEPGSSPLLVDYAKVYYSSSPPESLPLTTEGEPDPAYLLNP